MKPDRAIAFLAVGQTLIWASTYYTFPALILRWERDMGWARTDLTAALTIAILVSAAAAPLAGRLIDSGRGAAMMLSCCVLAALGLAGLSLAQGIWQFYAGWAALGVAMAGCLYEPCFALVTRARGEHARSGIIFITLVAGFASTISFPVLHGVSDAFGWRVAIVGAAVVAAAVAGPLLWYGVRLMEATAPPDPHAHEPAPAARYDFLRRPTYWFLAAGFALSGAVHSATLSHLLPILDDRGVAAESAVVAASFIGPMQVAGRLAMMAMEKKTSNHTIALASFGSMVLAMLALLASGAGLAFVVGFVTIFGAAYGTVSVLRPVIAREVLGGRNFGAKTGAMAVPYLIGAALAPSLGSLAWSAGGYNLMLGLAIAVLALGGASYVVARRLSGQAA